MGMTIGSAKLSQSDLSLPDRLKAYEKAGLKIFSFYIGGKLSSEGHTYQSEIPEAITQLKGHDTVLELYLQGSKKSNTDEQAIAFVQEIADLALEKSSLRVVLYPHAGFYIDTLSDAIRVARKCRRNNVGVMFNLCHYLKVEPKNDLKATLLKQRICFGRSVPVGLKLEERTGDNLSRHSIVEILTKKLFFRFSMKSDFQGMWASSATQLGGTPVKI